MPSQDVAFQLANVSGSHPGRGYMFIAKTGFIDGAVRMERELTSVRRAQRKSSAMSHPV